MAVAQIAKGAVSLAQRYGPAVYKQATTLVAKATGNRVADLSKLPAYVGASAGRLSVVTGAMVRAGIRPDDLVPEDLIGNNEQLAKIRQTLLATAENMQARYDAGSDNSLNEGVEGDIIRKKRVAAALRIYGSEETYFLLHPNGGIPRADFVWFRAMFNR